MRGVCFLRGVKFVVLAAIAVAAAGFAVMALWNGLIPDLFAGHPVTYLQAIGLLVLARLLFARFGGGCCGGGGHAHWRRRMLERWDTMTPEERDRFLSGMRGRCDV